jgi:hypothetical protein
LRCLKSKGAITVFISIVLSAVFLVVGMFTDGARLRIAHSQVQRANKTALSSVLACYNNELNDEYGLFGVYLDGDTLLETFEEYFTKNLNIIENQNYLYDFNIEDIVLKQPYSLENRDVVNNQIKEFMKYRAPYELATNLIDKVEGIKELSGGSKIFSRKMQTDQKAGEIGELQKSLEDKTRKINESKIWTTVSGFKDQFYKENEILKEKSADLLELQNQFANEFDKSKKDSLQESINILGHETDKINGAIYDMKKSIMSTVSYYEALNFQALTEAKAIADKKIDLQQRVDDELEYIEGLQCGIKEMRDSYRSDLNKMKQIVEEDNSSSLITEIQENISQCNSIENSAGLSDEELIKALEKLSSRADLDYNFVKAVSAESKDKDNRHKVSKALGETFLEERNLKTIDDNLLEILPSRKAGHEEEKAVQTWDNMNFNDISCATDNLDYISQKESMFGDIAGKVAEGLYINEYIMGTFIHGVPLLKTQQEKDAYNLRSKDKTTRDAFFSKYEVEYIINGNRSEAVNSMLVKSEILSVRLISNVMHIYTDTLKMSRITGLASALSAWCAGLSTPLIQTMLVFSWGMLESLYDMDQLSKGGQIPLFKSKEQWKTDLSGEIIQNKDTNNDSNPLSLSYQDYLKIFLIVMDSNKKLARIQDLIQLNQSISIPGFLMDDCKVFLKADTEVSIKNVFLSIPMFTAGYGKNIARSYIKEGMYLGY